MLQLNDEGAIKLGSAEWPAIGALSQTLNAKIFGEQGPDAILHGPLLTLVAVCAAVSAAGTLALARLPNDRWYKKWLPDPTMLGVGGLYSGLGFSALTLLIIALVFHAWLAVRHEGWFRRYQYVSTSGVNAGVGIAGLLVVLFTAVGAPMAQLGPVPAGTPADTCSDVSLPAQTDADVACWNYINGYTGCNTPWPSN